MPVDPQVAAFLQRIAAMNAPPIYTLTPAQARQTVPQVPPPYEPIAKVEDIRIPGPHGDIPLRIYTPDAVISQVGSASAPVLVFYHGGGWMLAEINDYEHLMRIFANALGCVAVSVGYRLAPEHKFPQGLDDCYAATAWATENAKSLGANPARLVVCGDSAGGNLAAAVCLMARDKQGPAIAQQLLIYPVTDCNFETQSYQENATGYMLTQMAMRWFWDAYLPDPSEARNPYAAPLQAKDLSRLPPAHVITAEFDPLRDEGEAYANRLQEAGVPVTSKRYAGMIHGFSRRTDLYDVASLSIREMIEEVKRENAT